MYLNIFEAELTPRTEQDTYPVQINEATLGILSLVFEFKVLTAPQITRFLTQKETDKYLYLKIRRMWQAGLLESFKIYNGVRGGVPIYYILSKQALKILMQQGKFHPSLFKAYPHPKSLFSWSIFRHEAQVAELASQEMRNSSKDFTIVFKGEASSQIHDTRSDKNIEVFTPDYTVLYRMNNLEHCIYTEYERTDKSKSAMSQKIERYRFHLADKDQEHTTIRFIFQTPTMEEAFWWKLYLGRPEFFRDLRILTTNLTLLSSHQQFLEPIYSSNDTMTLKRQGRVVVDLSERTKLLSFL